VERPHDRHEVRVQGRLTTGQGVVLRLGLANEHGLAFFSARPAARHRLCGGLCSRQVIRRRGIEEFPLLRDPARSAASSRSHCPRQGDPVWRSAPRARSAPPEEEMPLKSLAAKVF
jgi:hypothetical protein